MEKVTLRELLGNLRAYLHEGPFTEIDALEIERDDRYPVRVTVQFYKATSNGVVSEQDMAEIAAQINRVHQQADYVGSLVVQGPTGRPTEYEGLHIEPPDWWDTFWHRHLENTGQSREDAMELEEAGFADAAAKAMQRLLVRQRDDGRFESQQGQFDANGKAVGTCRRFTPT